MLDIAHAIENKRAADVMTSPVVTVQPDDTARKAAEEMLRLRVSGLPVVDRDGRPVGVVSESDFHFGDTAARKRLREAWVAILSGGQDIAADYLGMLEIEGDSVRQIMSTPAVSVDQDAPIAQVGDMMTAHRFKRILITRQDKLVGVVTRADLLRFFALPEKRTNAPITAEDFEAACAFVCHSVTQPRPPAPPAPPLPAGAVTAAILRQLVNAFQRNKSKMHDDLYRQAKEKRDEVVRRLLTEKFTDGELARLMVLAREAAAQGESEVTALVFPAALCNDGGRMINLPDPDWPRSLCGKAADFYLRWDKELRPLGFGLSARIVSFPDGFPGDAELSLVWGH